MFSRYCSGVERVPHMYGAFFSNVELGTEMPQPMHSTRRAASSSAYTGVCDGPPIEANALICGGDLHGVGTGRGLVGADPVPV